ncbi:uncharacterized protein LOC102801056 [Saccoglossus kowalevskii]|uniref:Uncharacterized protein LOC102801056 n=1 Tax=Saccoglossus kowalevskii TaxID=10224 RepID=A0ABM0MH00_SACKO|nr:PREDICTED: uncharacterized protein LOC102801056 [Saccoglossus kowalevskii]
MNQITLAAVCALFVILVTTHSCNAGKLTDAALRKRALSTTRCFGDADSMLSRYCFGMKRSYPSFVPDTEVNEVLRECVGNQKNTACKLAYYIMDLEERIGNALVYINEKTGNQNEDN